jgi:preprotein translocase subunit SecG
MFTSVLMLAHALICVFLVVVILLQRSEGGLGGLGGGGGAGALMGASSAASGIEKTTKYLFIAFVLTSLALSLMASRDGKSAASVLESAPITAPVPAAVPMAPVAE